MKNIHKYLDETIATAKGYLDRIRKKFKNTKIPIEEDRKIDGMEPEMEEKTWKVYNLYDDWHQW